jgi:predicted site-specific integrase-resolvase
MPVTINNQTYYRTAEVCRMVGISRNTLFRWLREGSVTVVEHRDYRGWRLFTQAQVDSMKEKTSRVVNFYLGGAKESSLAQPSQGS